MPDPNTHGAFFSLHLQMGNVGLRHKVKLAQDPTSFKDSNADSRPPGLGLPRIKVKQFVKDGWMASLT